VKLARTTYGVALISIAATGALIAGCGGSDDSSPTELSRPEFVAKATAICQPVNQQIEAAAKRYLGGARPAPQDFERFAKTAVVPDTQRLIDQFKQLTPPASETSAYAALIDELQNTNDRVKANPQLLAQQGNPYAGAQKLAKRAGLDACAAD